MKYDTIKEWREAAVKDIKRIEEVNRKRNNKGGVFVRTMHRSKGCEWEHVFVTDVSQNIMPHVNSLNSAAAIEEERRLLYVALTRAMDDLEVYSYGIESPFMIELNDKMQQKKAEKMLNEKPAPGTVMRHETYGFGILTKYEKYYMVIAFKDGTKTFLFPDALLKGALSVQKL